MYTVSCILFISITVSLEAVTVNPLCPTNKIAPRRKTSTLYQTNGRTFGAFYDLLTPNSFQNDSPNDLQEKPQDDDPDDCGEIEDYDENDLSSLTTKTQRSKGARNNGFFHDIFYNSYLGTMQTPHLQPQRPSHHVTRSPFWSGGFFGGNFYRPPPHQSPSDYVKPVHENTQAVQPVYRPQVVGGPLSHIVGYSTSKPSIEDNQASKLVRTPRYYSHVTTATPFLRRTRHPPPSKNEGNIFHSFVDLFFK